MGKNMRSACHTNVDKIMLELNKHTFLFVLKEGDKHLLLKIINDLWQNGKGATDGKGSLVRHMKYAIGREGKHYEQACIRAVQEKSVFVFDPKRDTINLVVDVNVTNAFPSCPFKPHNSRSRTGVNVTVGYCGKMIRFILFDSSCFREFL